MRNGKSVQGIALTLDIHFDKPSNAGHDTSSWWPSSAPKRRPQGAILIELMELWDDRAEYVKDHWNLLDVMAFAFCGAAFLVRVSHPDSLWGRALYAMGRSCASGRPRRPHGCDKCC